MKREIKFRAWYGHKMIHWSLFDMHGSDIGELKADIYCQIEDLTNLMLGNIMQYIGLRDKAGKEIYEGDIIKCPQTKFYLGIESWAVEYSDIWASYGWTDGGAWYTFKQEYDYEVIGNIYENPELL